MNSTIDEYPSRLYDSPQILSRLDPVVYADVRGRKQGPLAPQEITSYGENGYLFRPQVFSPQEVTSLQNELYAVCARHKRSEQPEVILEPGGDTVRSIFAIHRSNPLVQRLAQDRRLVDVVCQLLDSPVYIHQSRINYKPGFTGKEFYWHSDFETWHVEDGMPQMRAISCAISLSESHACNGPLMLIPGSHMAYVSCAGQTPEQHYKASLKKQTYGVPDHESLTQLVEQGGIATPMGPVGSVVFFDCNTMHGSTANITPWPRHSIFLVYNSVANPLVEPFCGLAPRPAFVASRDYIPVEPAKNPLFEENR